MNAKASRCLSAVFLLLLCAMPAWAQPPGESSTSVRWSDLGVSKPPDPTTSPSTEKLSEQQRESALREWERAKAEASGRPEGNSASAHPLATPKAEPEPEPSFAAQLGMGFVKAAGVLLVGGTLFVGIFWVAQKGMGVTSTGLTPHKVDPVGPIDRQRVRNFVNSPSPPSAAPGGHHDSDWGDDDPYDSYSYNE